MESYNGAVLSPNDALILLEASRQRLIPKITRRLRDHERQLIKPGSIFIWDEKEAKMRRWTDGRSWSASRVTGAFLTYREMEAISGSPTPSNGVGGTSPRMDNAADFRYKPDGLIKQSFSLTTLQGDKLHLISYTTTKDFSTSKFLNKTPSNDHVLKDIKIPKDVYPQHAFLDSTKDITNDLYNNNNSKSKSPLASPNSSTFNHFTQDQQQQELSQMRRSSSLSSIIPMSTSLPASSISMSQSEFMPSIPRSAIKLPPLNKTNIMRVDYDGRALNALDRMSFNY